MEEDLGSGGTELDGLSVDRLPREERTPGTRRWARGYGGVSVCPSLGQVPQPVKQGPVASAPQRQPTARSQRDWKWAGGGGWPEKSLLSGLVGGSWSWRTSDTAWERAGG